MSGTTGRERREVVAQPVGVVDPGRDFGQAGQQLARQSHEVAAVLDRTGEQLTGAVARDSAERGAEAANSEPIRRGPDGRVVLPTQDELRTGMLTPAYERAHREVLANRYGSEFLVQSQADLMRLRTQFTDPEKFREAAQAWRDGTVAEMPAAMRGPVGQAMAQVVGQHYRDLSAEQMRRQRADAAQASGQADGLLATQQFDVLAQGGDGRAALETRLGKIASDLKAGTIGEAEAQERVRHATLIVPILAAGLGASHGGAASFVEQMLPVEGTARNPGSTAEGYGQVVKGTWLALMRREAPELMAGKTDEQVLAMRGDATLARKLALAHVRKDIDPALRAAGVEPSNLARYAAWHFGPGVGPAVMKAGDSALMRDVVKPDQLAANPYLSKNGDMTVGAWKARFAGKFSAGEGDGIPEALRAGPGAPGWRDEWNGLTLDEREKAARFKDLQRSQARQETAYQEAQDHKAATVRAAAIDFEVGEIQSAAARENRALTVPELAKVQRLMAERHERMARFGDTGAAQRQVSATTEGLERQAGAEAVAGDAVNRGMGTLRAIDPTAANETARQIIRLPLADQARIIHARLAELGPAITATRQDAERRAGFADALAGNRRLDRTPANQALAMELIGGDMLAPEAQGRVLKAAAIGALPQGVVTRGNDLLRGGPPEQFIRYAQLHEAAMSDPAARDDWMKAQDNSLTRAWEGVAGELRGLDPSNKNHADQIKEIKARALARAENRGPKREDAEQELGTTAKEQEAAFLDLERRHLGTVPGVLWNSRETDARVPSGLRSEFRGVLLERIRDGSAPPLAADQAWQELQRRGWGVSRLGAEEGWRPSAARDLSPAVLAGMNGAEGSDMRAPPRWSRFAPERYEAPGKDGKPGTAWIEELMREAVKGLPDAAALVPGDTLHLVPRVVGGQERGYFLSYRDGQNLWHRVGAADGSAADLVLDLAALQAERKRAWAKSPEFAALKAGEEEQRRLGEAAAWPGSLGQNP